MDTNMTNKQEPLVSIIMAAHNADKYIAETIESVLSQNYTNWELIVTDDASTDNTRDIVVQYTKKDPRIKIIPLDKSVRQTVARIKAIKISSGEYLAILDADDISLPDRLKIQVNFLEINPDIAVVGSAAELINENGAHIGKKEKACEFTELAFKLLLQTQFIHSSVCMRKKTYDDIGGYDGVTYRIYAEEYDLLNRFVNEGYKLTNLPEILIKYRIHPQGISQSDFSGVRANLSTDVSEKYINLYFDAPRNKVKLMASMINGEKLSFFEILSALKWYRAFAQAYCVKKKLPSVKRAIVSQIYHDRVLHVLKTEIKNFLKPII